MKPVTYMYFVKKNCIRLTYYAEIANFTYQIRMYCIRTIKKIIEVRLSLLWRLLLVQKGAKLNCFEYVKCFCALEPLVLCRFEYNKYVNFNTIEFYAYISGYRINYNLFKFYISFIVVERQNTLQ